MLGLSWKRLAKLLVPRCWFRQPARCPRGPCHPSGTIRLPRFLLTLLLVGASALLVTVFSAGSIEEWLLRPPPVSLAGQRTSRMREKAAAFDAATLKLDAPMLYRLPNPGVCAQSDVFLVSFVVSKPAHRESREAIRRTWASVREVRGRAVRTLFALGVPGNPQEQESVERESARYGDLVQGCFVDTYLNLTIKTIMVMRWFATYCPSAQYLLKVDDDVFLNISNLVDLLIGLGAGTTDLYLGRVHSKVRVIRNVSSLYYVSEAVYLPDIYPNYCSGTAYVLSGDMAHKIYVASLVLPLLTIEDVFVGICAQRMGVLPTHTSKMSGGPRFHFSQCCYKSIIASHHVGPTELLPMWHLVNDGSDCSLLAKFTALFVCKLLNLLQIGAA
ncbi:beta-1,3-galactosyltransferase 9-like [Scyliorhinus torazame]|uniref:beta-1,3-galactosyltransferase 9-like n=1 Tax=Scyliorhinus torazame TaxID=75743 RepID=UPI003B5C107F